MFERSPTHAAIEDGCFPIQAQALRLFAFVLQKEASKIVKLLATAAAEHYSGS